MTKIKRFFQTLLFFNALIVTTFAQDSISISNNEHGLVEYAVQTQDSDTHVFTLYGDGTFGNQKTSLQHKFASKFLGYKTTSFFVKAYDPNVPTSKSVNTGSVGTGSNVVNPVFSMPDEIDVLTSWAVAYKYSNYFIIAFKNIHSPNPVSGCIEFYYDTTELAVDTTGILVYNNWVSNRSSSMVNINSYTKKQTWDFAGLTQGEVRYVYVPAKVKTQKKLNLSAVYSPNCTINDTLIRDTSSIWKNKDYIVRRFPHDPNFKIVDKECVKPDLPAQRLRYTIGFFNDGNDYAENVYLADTFSLLLNTFTPFVFDYEYQPVPTLNGPIYLLNFYNINLPGIEQTYPNAFSYEDAFSYVSFEICTQPYLPIGYCILNDATITFDTQASIRTDPPAKVCVLDEPCLPHVLCSARSEMGNEAEDIAKDIEQTFSFTVQPNPIAEQINIQLDFPRKENTSFTIDLVDYSGKRIKQLYQGDANDELLNKQFYIGDLPRGIYLIVVQTEDAIRAQKIIKQ